MNEVEYLAARLHGRRSRLAEGSRLDTLCRLPDAGELLRSIYPAETSLSVAGFQRQVAQDLASELAGWGRHLDGAEAALFAWLLARFQAENLKVLLRGWMTRTPLAALQTHLLPLPFALELDAAAFASADSLEAFAALAPKGPLRRGLQQAVAAYRDLPGPFCLEAALDCGYFRELLARTDPLPDEDRELIRPLLAQECDLFHLMLAVRGRFHYGLSAELLLPLHVGGTLITRTRFAAMLSAPDIHAAGQAAGRVVETPRLGSPTGSPPAGDAAALEALAWNRLLHLANRAFRRSHMGFGAVVGYAVIRRVETANLITLSEGLRSALEGASLRARLIPRSNLSGATDV
jgi:vacuolar-type H+-ATPase subunit C/Vma6